jgi:hypothetical protein
VHVLMKRSTENYFTTSAIASALGPQHRALGEYESLADMKPRWSKGSNGAIARQMSLKDFNGTDLDVFLSSIRDQRA